LHMAAVASAPVLRADLRARPRWGAFALLVTPLAWMIFFYLIPLGILLIHAFWSVDYLTINRTFTLANLRTIVENSLYPTVLARTVMIATAVTVTDVILAFPIAYYIAKRATRHRELLLMMVVFPLWSSYLVRAFAWKTILGTNGILNSFLLWTGIVDQPVSAFLYSKTAMYITFCQVWLPFMILPLYTILDRLPNSLLEAASDLGSNWPQTLRRVILPLSLPGILAGSLSVFSLTMGDYITPSLIGGSPGTELIGGIVADQFGVANNWPLGAALILPVLVIISVFLLLANRAGALGRGEAG
jgi:spermidine/putrescine transport system permease protein